MAIDSVSQLTPAMQAAVPGALGVPAPVLPLPNAIDQQAAPDQQPVGPAGPVVPIGAPPVPETTSSPVVNAIHDGINQAAAATPPSERGKPGQWAKQILSGLSHAFSNVETSLGDIQTANESLAKSNPYGGGGILGGLGAIENAKAKRLEGAKVAQTQEDRERGQIAYTNAMTMLQEQTLHSLKGKVAEDANNQAIQNGLASYNMAVVDPASYGLEPAKVIKGGGGSPADITESELQKAITDQSWDPTKEQYAATSKVPSIDGNKQRIDSEGNPMWEKRYTIFSTPPTVKLSKDNADFLNANIPGSHWEEGTPMPGASALMLFQQAANSHAVQAKRASDLEEADIKLSSLGHTKEQINSNKKLDADPDYQKARAHISGLENLALYVTGQSPTGGPEIGPDGKPTGKPAMDPQSVAYAQSHPNALVDIRNSYGFDKKTGESIFDKILADQQEKEALAKDKAAAARGEKVPKNVNEATAAITTATIAARDNPTPENKQALLDAHIRLDDLRSADVSQKYADAAQRVKATRDAETDDLKTVAVELIKPDNLTALKDISSWRGDERIRLYAEAKKLDSNFQASTADRKIRFLGQFTNPNGRIMNSIASGNTFLEHAGDLHDVNQSYSFQNEKIVRTPVTEIQKLFGATAYTQLLAAINPVREEYSNALAAGYVPQGPDKEAADALLNDHSTPAQIEVAARQMSHTLLRRMDSSNQTYRTNMGGNYPDLITPNAREAVGKLGDKELQAIIDGYDTGGTIGAGPQVSPSAGQTHQGAPARTPAPNKVTAPTGAINVNPNVTDWAGQFGGVKR